MQRSYYSKSIPNFLNDTNSEILGELSKNHLHSTLEDLQINSWIKQIDILKNSLVDFQDGFIFFEFSIPRMGKRVDNIFIYNGLIFVIEFKINANSYEKYAIDQAIDYAVDLKNFHEGSHNKNIIPILVATEASKYNNAFNWAKDNVSNCLRANKNNFSQVINDILIQNNVACFDCISWENSQYKPTPTIVEAAKALYAGHNVQEISRSDAGAKNLSATADCIFEIVQYSKVNNCKSICFVTGVPGAGKTLAGLNIATQSMNHKKDELAVFLSGNGPLVAVLQEALARDKKLTSELTKNEATMQARTFVQHLHHFRDENVKSDLPPIEKVFIYDEAQRAWDKDQTCKFMRQKRGNSEFSSSEPEFLINVMNRHSGWCTIICLIGGGQEINTGEAGLMEWFYALKTYFPHWHIFYSNQIIHKEYTNGKNLQEYLLGLKTVIKQELHLSVSVRSFRSENLSEFARLLIDNKPSEAANICNELKNNYPIYITRDLKHAKNWIRKISRGSERYGIITSSGAIRLRPFGINVKAKIDPSNWFLNDKYDVRSSYYLEEAATEFEIQGLELDWTILAWDANLRYSENNWEYYKFSGTKWNNITKTEIQKYLLNSYRVLLTRARQGMVIFLPMGDKEDSTRLPEFYDGIYNYIKSCGVEELKI